jgi:hypothetical protein
MQIKDEMTKPKQMLMLEQNYRKRPKLKADADLNKLEQKQS